MSEPAPTVVGCLDTVDGVADACFKRATIHDDPYKRFACLLSGAMLRYTANQIREGAGLPAEPYPDDPPVKFPE